MGFNRRKMEDRRRQAAEKEAAARRATDAQVLEDAERLIAAWNERQALRAPMIFSPTIGAAIAVGYWFLWVRCPACRAINAIDLRTLDRHPDAAVSSLVSALSLPIVPAKRAVRRARAAIANEHRRRNAGRTSSSRAGANDRLTKAAEKCRRDRDHVVLVTECLRKPRRRHRKTLQKNSSGLSVIHEFIANGEKALHPTDRFSDYAVGLSGLKLAL